MVEVTNALEGNSANKANISTPAAIPQQYVLDRFQLPTSDTPVLRLVTPQTLADTPALQVENTPAFRLEKPPALRLENTSALQLVMPQHSGW